MSKKGLLAGIDASDVEPQATNHYDKPIFDIIEEMFEFAKSEFESPELSEQIEQFITQYKETYTGTSSVPKSVVYNLMVVMRALSFHQPLHHKKNQRQLFEKHLNEILRGKNANKLKADKKRCEKNKMYHLWLKNRNAEIGELLSLYKEAYGSPLNRTVKYIKEEWLYDFNEYQKKKLDNIPDSDSESGKDS